MRVKKNLVTEKTILKFVTASDLRLVTPEIVYISLYDIHVYIIGSLLR